MKYSARKVIRVVGVVKGDEGLWGWQCGGQRWPCLGGGSYSGLVVGRRRYRCE